MTQHQEARPDLRALLALAEDGEAPPPLPESGQWTNEQATEYERRHGHDIRLNCYPEFGCQVRENAVQGILNVLPELLDVVEAAEALNRNAEHWRDGWHVQESDLLELSARLEAAGVDVQGALAEKSR